MCALTHRIYQRTQVFSFTSSVCLEYRFSEHFFRRATLPDWANTESRTCACAIVEVDMRDLYALRQRVRVHGKVVVLGTDLDAA